MSDFTAVDLSTSMHDPDIANEYVAAGNERATARNLSTVSTIVTGGNVQGFRSLLSSPYSLCTYFVQSHDLDGTPRAANYYDGKTTIDMWTWENLCKAAGCWIDATHYGFPCIGGSDLPEDFADPSDLAFTLRNWLAWGDVVHPSVYYWLGRFYPLLIWTRHVYGTGSLDLSSSDGESYYGRSDAATLTAWSTMQTNAENSYYSGQDVTFPYNGAKTWKREFNFFQPPYSRRTALLGRARCKYSVTLSDVCTKDLYWYCKVHKFATFNAYGDSPWDSSHDGKYQNWDVAAGATAGDTSDYTCSTASSSMPAPWCGDPNTPQAYPPIAASEKSEGYYLTDPVAIAQWDFDYK